MSFGRSDIYIVCRLQPLTTEIRIDPKEILDATWLPLSKFQNAKHPVWHEEGCPLLREMGSGGVRAPPYPTLLILLVCGLLVLWRVCQILKTVAELARSAKDSQELDLIESTHQSPFFGNRSFRLYHRPLPSPAPKS